GQPRSPITGVSLLGAWQGKPTAPDRVLAGELFGQTYIRQGDWKLRSGFVPDSSPASLNAPRQWQLFNLVEDRGETRDLAAQYPDKVSELMQAWGSYARWAGLPEAD